MFTNRFTDKTPTMSGTDALDTNYAFNGSPFTAKVIGLKLIPVVSVSTHASNYITITAKNGSTTLATFTTNSSGGAAMTAGTPITMTLSGTGTDLEIAADGLVTFNVTKNGTGPAYEFVGWAGFEAIH